MIWGMEGKQIGEEKHYRRVGRRILRRQRSRRWRCQKKDVYEATRANKKRR